MLSKNTMQLKALGYWHRDYGEGAGADSPSISTKKHPDQNSWKPLLRRKNMLCWKVKEEGGGYTYRNLPATKQPSPTYIRMLEGPIALLPVIWSKFLPEM